MDSNDAEDGVAAPDVSCGRSVVFVGDTNIRDCSYRRDEDLSSKGARSCGDARSEKVLHKSCLDLTGISFPGDDD